MGIADVVWMTLILGGTGYLLYRSVWQKKGHCRGCESAVCSARPSPNGCRTGMALAVLCVALPASAEQVRYTTHIKAVFDRQCAGCHGGDAPEYGDFKKDKAKFTGMSQGPKMDSYAHLIFYAGWPDTGALMRRLDDGSGTNDGKAGNMYRHLGSDEEERQKNLKLFREWVGNWTHKRFPDLTKEDLAGIVVAY